MEPVLVLCAVEEEATHLREKLARAREVNWQMPWRCTEGAIGGMEVRLVVTNIGVANAAAAASAMLATSPRPCAVVNYGCAGAHDERLYEGDVVLGESVVPMDAAKILPDGTKKLAGYRCSMSEDVPLALTSDKDLLASAATLAERLSLPAWPGRTIAPSVRRGIIGSSDTWTQNRAAIKKIRSMCGTICEEMEAAAIASVCASYVTPFLCVKDISNNELHTHTGGSDGSHGLANVMSQIGLRASCVVEALLIDLGQQQQVGLMPEPPMESLPVPRPPPDLSTGEPLLVSKRDSEATGIAGRRAAL